MNLSGKPLAFQAMAKPIGSTCNLNCRYCYYLEKKKLYNNFHDFRMKKETLESFIRQYIAAQDVPQVTFVWQGGEPSLLGLDFYKEVIEFQQKYAGNKKIDNCFQTNGTLLDDEWCTFFKKNKFLVGLSVDGPEFIHNSNRVSPNGKPSFKQVMKSLELLNKHNVEFNTLSVVDRNNSNYPLEIYNFLKEAGSHYLQFIPIIERKLSDPGASGLSLVPPEDTNAVVTDWTVRPEKYGDFIIKIFDEWVRNDVGKYFIQLFDVTLANSLGVPSGLCIFSDKCGDAPVVEFNGDVYSCDHYVYPQYFLGNIMTKSLHSIMRSAEQLNFGEKKLKELPDYCIICQYRFACHGGCPKHRFCNTPDGKPGLNYLCMAYKKIFNYVHPYMQYMGNELKNRRPPANVMNWAKGIALYNQTEQL